MKMKKIEKKKKFVRESTNELIWEYKKFFFGSLLKWGTLISIFVFAFYLIGITFIDIVYHNRSTLEILISGFFSGLWFFISNWYIMLPVSLIWFVRRN